MRSDVIIVGGGAAGLAAAIFAARRSPQLRIAVLDGARKLGAKILVSGGGRCNVTNVRVTPDDFCGGSRNTIRKVLSAFNERQAAEFFSELGVGLHEEQWGKLFPNSNSAKTVLNALIAECERLGVALLPGHRVVGVERNADGGFRVAANSAIAGKADPPESPLSKGGGTERTSQPIPARLPVDFVSRVVVLATGGMSLPKTGSDGFGYELAKRLGHSIVPPTPALAPLVLDDDFHAPLSGIAHETELTIRAVAEKPVRISGPMLWTHFGASGPAAMDASRHWHRAVLNGETPRITVNFLPGADFVSAERMLTELAASQAKVLARNALAANLPARLVERLMEAAGVPQGRTMGQLTRDERRRLVHALTEWPMPVRDSRGYNYAEATAGGVPLTEIDPATMQSRVCPGLFLVGEVLDVDGRIGGFNFQWAWSTGYVAGEGVGRS